jgi:hypothetical protein
MVVSAVGSIFKIAVAEPAAKKILPRVLVKLVAPL